MSALEIIACSVKHFPPKGYPANPTDVETTSNKTRNNLRIAPFWSTGIARSQGDLEVAMRGEEASWSPEHVGQAPGYAPLRESAEKDFPLDSVIGHAFVPTAQAVMGMDK
jgi:hypothetical protein